MVNDENGEDDDDVVIGGDDGDDYNNENSSVSMVDGLEMSTMETILMRGFLLSRPKRQ